MKHGGIVDAARIEGARHGRAEDLETVLRAVWPHAFRVALSILRSTAAAEDAAQEACAIVVHSIADLRNAEAFGVWFYRIVVREALRIERRFRRADVAPEGLLESDGSLYGILVRVDVLRALGKLTSTQRAVITMRYYAELNSREIGAVLRIPEGTVRFHLSAARRELETLLDAHRESSAGEGRVLAI